MFPLLAALLLAAWLTQPWSYIDAPASPAMAQTSVSAVSRSAAPPEATPERLLLKELRYAQKEAARAVKPAPAPVPASPTPTPPTPAPPTPAPKPAPAVQVPTDGLEALVCSYSWPCQEALAVARCESGVDSAGRLDGIFAASSRSSYGLFQINSVHARRFPEFWESWMDPAKNTAWAFQIWSEQGWRPWSCRPH